MSLSQLADAELSAQELWWTSRGTVSEDVAAVITVAHVEVYQEVSWAFHLFRPHPFIRTKLVLAAPILTSNIVRCTFLVRLERAVVCIYVAFWHAIR